MLNKLKQKIIITLSIFLLSILSMLPTETHAAVNFFVDPSIINKTFSNWDSSTEYNENDLVMYDNKVYSAAETLSGCIPATDSKWICKADLTYFNTISESDECSLIANSINSNLRYEMEIEVLKYKGVISQNTYDFTVVPKLGLFSTWTAFVWSFISYQDGEHTIYCNR